MEGCGEHCAPGASRPDDCCNPQAVGLKGDSNRRPRDCGSRRNRYHETLRQGSDCPERQARWETVRNGWTDKPTLGHPVEVDQRSETSHAIRQEEIRGSVVRPLGLSCETRVSTHVKMSRAIF